jgi:pimeloyl-ACP methyl ester carboxylesterase
MKRALLVLGISAACSGGKTKPPVVTDHTELAPANAPPGEEVTVTAGDGVTIAGTYYPPAGEVNGCVVFVHQLSSTRAEWQPVIDRVREGKHIVAIDMRGHGASKTGADGAVVDWQKFETADWEKVEDDIGKVMDLLAAKGASPPCILVGASIGSSAVLRYSGTNPSKVRALVLLSPGLGYRGVMTPDAARASQAPVLIVRSEEPGAADAAGALKEIWEGVTPPVHVEIIVDPGQAHGMKIVKGDPAILDKVVAFIKQPPK